MRVGMMTVALFLFGVVARTNADDWPQWLGPQRDSVWRETGIIEAIPDDGLPVAWRAEVGLGYSGPAVADGRVYVLDYVKTSGDISNSPGARDKLNGLERIQCFHATTGESLWKHEYEKAYAISYPRGPRCTPTIAEGKVYALGAEGDLSCLDAKSGRLIWHKDLVAEYKTKTPMWGFSAHPLVDGDLLYCVVGGEGSVAVAFDKDSGREVWRALSASEPGYCPPTMIEHADTKQLLIWHPESLNSLNPITGDLYWSIPLKPAYRMSVTAPRKSGSFLFASGIGEIGAMIKLDDAKPAAKVVWRGTPRNAVYSCNSTPFMDSKMIYGCDCGSGKFMGVRVKDGERLWETFEPIASGTPRRVNHGTAFLVKNEDRYFLFNEKGDLIVAKLSADGYQEQGRQHLLAPTNSAFGRDVVWSHPAFANRCVFARNDKEIVCVKLAK